MNIGIDIRGLRHGNVTGVGSFTISLLNEVFKQGQKHKFFLFDNGFKKGQGSKIGAGYSNVKLIEKTLPNKLLSSSLTFFNYPKLDRWVEKNLEGIKLDIWFSPNLSFSRISQNTKHIIMVHDISFKLLPDCYSFKRRLWHKIIRPEVLLKNADSIITPSHHTKRDVVDYFDLNPEKIEVIYPGASPIEKHEDWLYKLPKKYILTLSTLEPRKNIESTIAGFLDWKYKNEQALGYELLIAGPTGWKCGKLKKLIHKHKDIRYIGYVSTELKSFLYTHAGAFIYPSFYEGFGMPILEALTYGVPVITSNRSSLPEVVGKAAYLVHPYNYAEITEGLHHIMGSKELRDQYKKIGYEQVQKFSWERSAQKFLNVCQKLQS